MDTYGSTSAKDMTFSKLRVMFKDAGVNRIYVKYLSPNDNSKNQPYFGGDYSSLNIIPTGKLVAAESTSRKKTGGPKKVIFKAPLKFSWISPEGSVLSAPNAQLILYPQYPEVRFSGFLKGSPVKMSQWMDPYKEGRSEGRVLILGVTGDERVLGYLAIPGSQLSQELALQPIVSKSGVFSELSLKAGEEGEPDNKQILLSELRRIHLEGWIRSKRLDGLGNELGCNSPNCGGYTLEAEFGIRPNGYSEPDYLGWELKQFGVQSFEKIESKVVTLMTPEPTSGLYKDEGVEEFLRRYGYEDLKGREDRINFGGVHRCGIRHARTHLTLMLEGYDEDKKRINDPDGGMCLVSEDGHVAAKWDFGGLIEHWKRKHSHAVYVPSLSRTEVGREYRYGNVVKMCEGTDFAMFLHAMMDGAVYYDPGIKMENASAAKPVIKRRSQFRIKTGSLASLYQGIELVNVCAD